MCIENAVAVGCGTGKARPILSVLLLVFYTPILMGVECLKKRLLRSTDSLCLWKARGAEEEVVGRGTPN